MVTDVLGAVEMPQRHIVKVGKNGGIHIVAAAHTLLLGVAGLAAGDKLVGQEHVPLCRVNPSSLPNSCYARTGSDNHVLLPEPSIPPEQTSIDSAVLDAVP